VSSVQDIQDIDRAEESEASFEVAPAEVLSDVLSPEEETVKGATVSIAPPPGIPKSLHIIWVGPHDPPQEAIDTWANKHVNGWFFTLWRGHKQDWINQEQIDVRAARAEWNGVADLMRYEILYEHGGFCVDADSTCVMALDAGPVDFLGQKTALACFENESVRPGIVGCGFLGAPKKHPFFEACIEFASKQDAREMAWKTVGPMLMTRMAQKMPDLIKVYPARSFNPEHYSGTKAPGEHPIYGFQHWGSTTTYNKMRKWPCQCGVCRMSVNILRPSWG
jgi:hypothetical protein